MMGEIVTRNMQSKAIANKKRNCCILLDLFHHYTVASVGYFNRSTKNYAFDKLFQLISFHFPFFDSFSVYTNGKNEGSLLSAALDQ